MGKILASLLLVSLSFTARAADPAVTGFRVNGTPGVGQDATIHYMPCQVSPEGVVVIQSCRVDLTEAATLNEAVVVRPGLYLVGYGASTAWVTVTQDHVAALNLKRLDLSATEVVSVVLDMTSHMVQVQNTKATFALSELAGYANASCAGIVEACQAAARTGDFDALLVAVLSTGRVRYNADGTISSISYYSDGSMQWETEGPAVVVKDHSGGGFISTFPTAFMVTTGGRTVYGVEAR